MEKSKFTKEQLIKAIERANDMAKYYDKEVVECLQKADEARMNALKERLLAEDLSKQLKSL